MSKTILITGATGFIGSFLAEEAVRQGFSVVAGVRSTSNRRFLKHLDISYAELNLANDRELLRQLELLQREGKAPDYIIHNAGITHAKKNEDFVTTNYQYTKNLAEAAHAVGIPLEKFVLVSSLASYGPGKESLQPICVSDNKNPVSRYGISKMMAEEYMSSQSAFQYLIINPTAVYGPRDSGFLSFFKMLNNGLEAYIGPRGQMVSMIYVKDLANAIILATKNGVSNRSLFVSDNNSYSKEELSATARQLLSKTTVKLRLPLSVVRSVVGAADSVHRLIRGYEPFLNREKLHEISQPNWLCDSSETWQLLNSQPSYSLKDGFKETVAWYKENGWL